MSVQVAHPILSISRNDKLQYKLKLQLAIKKGLTEMTLYNVKIQVSTNCRAVNVDMYISTFILDLIYLQPTYLNSRLNRFTSHIQITSMKSKTTLRTRAQQRHEIKKHRKIVHKRRIRPKKIFCHKFVCRTSF